jgi:hypothetical protein
MMYPQGMRQAARRHVTVRRTHPLTRPREADVTSTMVEQGDLLYVDRTVHGIAQCPDGLAVLVQEVLGWADHQHTVRIRAVIVDHRVPDAYPLILSLPVGESPPEPMSRSTGESAPGVAAAGDETGLVGPPPGYARRVFGLAQQ